MDQTAAGIGSFATNGYQSPGMKRLTKAEKGGCHLGVLENDLLLYDVVKEAAGYQLVKTLSMDTSESPLFPMI